MNFRRECAVEVRGLYDGALFYECPDCGGTWPRWTPEEEPRLYRASLKYVHGSRVADAPTPLA